MAAQGTNVAVRTLGASSGGKPSGEAGVPYAAHDAVEAAAKQIESYLRSMNRAVEFRVDDQSGKTVVTVRDNATGEVIRQIPSEEVLELARTLDQRAGALINIAV